MGEARYRTRRWTYPDSNATLTEVVPGGQGRALMLGTVVPATTYAGPMAMLMYTRAFVNALWYTEQAEDVRVGRTALQLTCHPIATEFLCSASSRSLVELWRLAEGGPRPMGRLAGWHWPEGHASGWLLRDGASTVTVHDVEREMTVRFAVDDLPGFPEVESEWYASGVPWNAWSQLLAYRNGRLAVARSMGDSTAVVVYQLGVGSGE